MAMSTGILNEMERERIQRLAYENQLAQAQAMQSQQLGQLGVGAGLAGLAQGVFGGGGQGAFSQHNPYAGRSLVAEPARRISEPKPEGIREELQVEVDDWLKDIS